MWGIQMKTFNLLARLYGAKVLFVLTSVSLFAFAFNNCGRGFSVANPGINTLESSSSSEFPDEGIVADLAVALKSVPRTEWISLKNVGSNKSDCLSDPNFDACIFYKNPFVQSLTLFGTGFKEGLKTGDDLSSIQTFGVKLAGRKTPKQLFSSSVIVKRGAFKSTLQKPSDVQRDLGNQIKVPYGSDKNSVTAMTHAFFWLQQLEAQLKARTNIYFAAQKKVEVFLLDGDSQSLPSSLLNNAFWSSSDSGGRAKTNWISLGIANQSSRPGYYEEGLDAEVLLHEMGHANFAYAKGFPQGDIFADNYGYDGCRNATDTACTSPVRLCGRLRSPNVLPKDGCQSAINEGLADFHYLMMFPDYPSIWETNLLSEDGLISRNMNVAKNKKVSDFISGQFCDILDANKLKDTQAEDNCEGPNGHGGVSRDNAEIHLLGTAYASILFGIYSDPKTDKRAFETTFLLHLQQIGPSTRFPESRDLLLAIDENQFESVNSRIIRSIFSAKGIY